MLYYSLYNVCPDFKLYIISFDNKCYDSLVGKELDNIIVIKYSDFENDTLKEAKSNRNRREYLWTCSSFGIKYILEKYDLEVCTYLDSDLFFYSDPTNVIKNFINSNKDEMIDEQP